MHSSLSLSPITLTQHNIIMLGNMLYVIIYPQKASLSRFARATS